MHLMDVAMEDSKWRRQQRWCLTAAAAGCNGGQWWLIAATDHREGGNGDRGDKMAKGGRGKDGI